jgi:hypothetical protein
MPCGNSSNINVSKTFVEVNPAAYSSSRFIVTIPSGSYTPGITGGDVIYYDVATATYKKAKADDAITSEVFGVVEARNSISGSIDVVTQGSINFPSTGFTATSGGGGAGGLDVYFLSDTDAGKIQPLAPTEVGHIVKPVYQVGSHGGSYTGLVTNYIGYNIGTEVETTVGGFSSGLGSLVFTHGTIDDPSYVDLTNSNYTFLPVQGNEELFNIIRGRYGFVYSIKLKRSDDSSPITLATSATLGGTSKQGAYWIGYYESGKQDRIRQEDEITDSVTTIKPKYRISIFGASGSELNGGTRIYHNTWNQFYTNSNNFRDSIYIGLRDSDTEDYGDSKIIQILKDEDIYDETVWYFSTGAEGREIATDYDGTNPASQNVGNSANANAKNGLNSTTSNDYKFIVDTWSNSIGYDTDGYNIVLAEAAKIIGFYLPRVKVNYISDIASVGLNISNYYGSLVSPTTGGSITANINVYMKVKDTGMSSYLPRSVSIEDTLTVPTLKYGESEEDLETKINSIISRLQTVENRLRIIP